MKITVSEILKGCTAGKMQSAGYMQMIPLCSEPNMIDERFSPFSKLMTSTTNYGTLVVENREQTPSILPMCAGIMSKQAAQNHASGKVKLMGGMSKVVMNDAACVQQSQGGTIPPGVHNMTILPYSIREEAVRIRHTRGYDKLWPAISGFNKNIGVQNIGHLEYYLDEFENNLDEFIGQFEIITNQVGAIIILNGQVAGIERAPNYEYWKDLWKPLIRECYGSASLTFAKTGVKQSPPLGRMPINGHNVKDLDSLEAEFNKAEDFEDEAVKETIRNFIGKPFKMKREENEPNGTLCVDHLSGSQFTGQIVRDEDRVVYASLMPDKNARFNIAAKFDI
jgi:hypothetical protein